MATYKVYCATPTPFMDQNGALRVTTPMACFNLTSGFVCFVSPDTALNNADTMSTIEARLKTAGYSQMTLWNGTTDPIANYTFYWLDAGGLLGL